MTYAEAVAHLYALGPELSPAQPGGAPRKFDLAHMHTLCAALGDPQRRVPALLIAGTNGKGSTAATLASILTAAGYRTGLYTSPHLIRPNERIQLAHAQLPSEYGSLTEHGTDGALRLEPIADHDFARLYTQVDAACEQLTAAGQLPVLPSFFERLTAMAFLYFAGSSEPGRLEPGRLEPGQPEARQPAAEIMVLEVGLGGRLDATNVVDPLLSIVTDIALDHQEYLGDTIAQITAEKCGILRPHGTLITLPQHPEANQAIGEAAMRLQVHGVSAAEYLPPAQRNAQRNVQRNAQRISSPELPANHYTLNTPAGQIEIDSPLPGQHQQRNLALALAAALTLRTGHGFDIPNAAIEAGVRMTQWPGRLERLRHPDETLILDVAHNPAGAWTLRAAIATLPEATPRTLIFSCLRDKNLEEMSRILFPLFDSSPDGDHARRHDHIVLAPIASPRAAAVADLLAAATALGIPAHAAPHLAGALAQARQVTPPGGLIFATGSVYLVGEVRELALKAAEAVHA